MTRGDAEASRMLEEMGRTGASGSLLRSTSAGAWVSLRRPYPRTPRESDVPQKTRRGRVLLPLLLCVAAFLAFVGWRIAEKRAPEPVAPAPIERPVVAAEPTVRDAPAREGAATAA